MRINTNISALKANSYLNTNNNALTKSLEKLSSGYRINHAADDAAGMAISQKMRTQIAALDQADRNSSDGISLIQTAEGALSEVTAMLQRMRQLSVQAANGSYTDEDRTSIQAEINELGAEIDRISNTTEFNTVSLLDGSSDRKSFSDLPSVELISASDSVSVGNYQINVQQNARQAVVAGVKIGKVANVGSVPEGKGGIINVNGIDINIKSGDDINTVYEKLREGCERVNINVIATGENAEPGVATSTNAETAQYSPVALDTSTTSKSELVFISKEYGAEQKIEIKCSNTSLADMLGINTSGVSAHGYDVEASIVTTDPSCFAKTATLSKSGNEIIVKDLNGFEMKLEASAIDTTHKYTDAKADGTVSKAPTTKLNKEVNVTVLDAGSIKLQVGANEGQTVEIAIPKVNTKTLGLSNANVLTTEGAEKAITKYDNAVTQVSTIRAKLGAYQNRMEYTVSNLQVAGENLTEALSRIQDTDMASEMATYTQYNVLVQAGTSMLAQANQRPQQILSLLNA